MLGISGWLGLIVLGIWLVVAFVSRYSSMAALLASLGAPVRDAGFWMAACGRSNTAAGGATPVVMAALLVWRHRDGTLAARSVAAKKAKLAAARKRNSLCETRPDHPQDQALKLRPKTPPSDGKPKYGRKSRAQAVRSTKKNKHKK